MNKEIAKKDITGIKHVSFHIQATKIADNVIKNSA